MTRERDDYDPAYVRLLAAIGKFPIAKISRHLGIAMSGVSRWHRCPPNHARALSAMVGGAVTPAELIVGYHDHNDTTAAPAAQLEGK